MSSLRTKEIQSTGLTENRAVDHTSNEECRNQAGKKILSGILLKHPKGFEPGLPDNRVAPRDKVGHERQGRGKQLTVFFFQKSKFPIMAGSG